MERLVEHFGRWKKFFKLKSIEFTASGGKGALAFAARRVIHKRHMDVAVDGLRDFAKTGTIARSKWNPAKRLFELAFVERISGVHGARVVWKVSVAKKRVEVAATHKLSDLQYAILSRFLNDLHPALGRG